MSVYIYNNGQYHILSGNKIVKDHALIPLKASDQMIANHRAYSLGNYSSDMPVPSIPDAPTISHNQSSKEPSGQKWYVSPSGAGDQSGTSWANARSGAQLHVTLLDAERTPGHIYMMAGDYELSRTLTLPAGVNVYGGFPVDNPSWSTRNAFTNQTKLTGDGSFLAFDGAKATAGQTVDGICLRKFDNSVSGANMTLRNSMVYCASVALAKADHCVFNQQEQKITDASECNIFTSETNISNANSCLFLDCTYLTITTAATDCKFIGHEGKLMPAVIHNATRCEAMYCSAAEDSLFVGDCKEDAAYDCTAERGICDATGNNEQDGGQISNCNSYNCTANYIYVAKGGDGRRAPYPGGNGGNITGCMTYASIARIAVCCCDGGKGGCVMDNRTYECGGQGGRGGSADGCIAYNCTTTGSIYTCNGGDGGRGRGINGNSDQGGGHGGNRGTITGCMACNCTATGSIYTCNGGDGGKGLCGLGGQGGGYKWQTSVCFCNSYNCHAGADYMTCNGGVGNIGGYGWKEKDGDEGLLVQNLVVSSTANGGGICSGPAETCTIVNCIAATVYRSKVTNCVSWGNSGMEYGDYKLATSCAGSVHDSALALTLGTDNSVARFENTGFAPAKGVQDVGQCPNPITDKDGYDAWLAQFGDWHPRPDSFLVGKGLHNPDVTTDLDGVARPNPPTIGAYEPYPA